jgi:hypothetical protein
MLLLYGLMIGLIKAEGGLQLLKQADAINEDTKTFVPTPVISERESNF